MCRRRQWVDAADRETEDVMNALNDALALLDENEVLYKALSTSSRRLVNQAIFQALIA